MSYLYSFLDDDRSSSLQRLNQYTIFLATFPFISHYFNSVLISFLSTIPRDSLHRLVPGAYRHVDAHGAEEGDSSDLC
ncbi:hypothetical protein HYC85_025730 [Camellia sinensis]|uniref:Uncharacterized protein n=1 Tax=Camellia sinensis TaxID=4442 RepID=A0A7J7GFR1_CAMSI|nr:hypothetical protein HYC85_025730 [Camellia sinensis]